MKVFTHTRSTTLMYDGTEQDLLCLLASRAGISPEYYDIAGTLHVTSDDTRRAILSAMGFDTTSRESLATTLADWDEASWRQPCDPILILEQGYGPTRWAFRLPLEEKEEAQLVLTWHLCDEKGTVVHREDAGPRLIPQEVHVAAGRRMVRLDLPLVPNLALGYYDLSVVGTVGTLVTKAVLRVVVAPPHCYVPPGMAQGQRVWGLAVQLYALRSRTNWG
ncbi:MAG TPA: hypothetical protein PKD43_12860, partial [Nitrospira sp.]|nr:hypothetical protein [Nitrospira sp.]HNG02794.1 hypothetical protein [Nitrospira sp.]